MKNKRKLIIIVGTSGSGKSTLENELTKHNFRKLISTTTRPLIRKDDVEGESYYFVSEDKFNETILFESVSFAGNSYGLTRREFYKDEQDVVAVVEPKGMLQLIKNCTEFDIKIVFFNLSKLICLKNMTDKRGDDYSEARIRLLRDNIKSDFDKSRVWPDYQINEMKPMIAHVNKIKEL